MYLLNLPNQSSFLFTESLFIKSVLSIHHILFIHKQPILTREKSRFKSKHSLHSISMKNSSKYLQRSGLLLTGKFYFDSNDKMAAAGACYLIRGALIS